MSSTDSRSTFRCFAILPAAGRSRRMGQSKLMLPWDGAPVIHRVLRIWTASRADAVIVVVHPISNPVVEVVRDSPAHLVVPETAPPDMKASVLAGLAYVRDRFSPAATDAWLLAPADMPLLETETIDQVVTAYDPQAPRIVVPNHGDRRGHPVLLPWSLAADVERLGEHEGIDSLIRREPCVELPCSQAAILEDLDTPEDYRRQLGRRESSP